MFKSAGVSKQDLRDPETAGASASCGHNCRCLCFLPVDDLLCLCAAAVMAALEEHKMVPEGSTEGECCTASTSAPAVRAHSGLRSGCDQDRNPVA